MFRKVAIGVFCVLICMHPYFVCAQVQDYQNDELVILFIYSTSKNEKNGNVKKIDMLLRHFTNRVQTVSEQEVKLKDFTSATHVVYYGEKRKKMNDIVLSGFRAFPGPIIAIGENVEQISRFADLHFVTDGKMNGVSLNQKTPKDVPMHRVKRFSKPKNANVWLYGHRGEETFPIFVQINHHDFYFAVTSFIDSVVSHYFADLLHDIFPNDHPHEHLAYLRLEDIHPQTDPEKLLEVGEYLIQRNIPFLLVVIPVYIDPKTGEKVYFSKSSKLLRVLHYLQKNGGTVIAHGYTHQYRESETGEGFEFWDVENDQMIVALNPEDEVERVKTQDYFANAEDYQSYMESLKRNERTYIEDRLRNSIHELVRYELYPLGFEVPHYTISQQGYTVISEYFSSIFGKLQLDDRHWKVMDSPPYVTTAEHVNGMTIYPETIGFVDPLLPNSIQKIENLIQQAAIVRDGVIGGFYHPYLGLDHLPPLIHAIEKIPNVTWLDLKQTKQHVNSERVEIISNDTGEVVVKNDLSWRDEWKKKLFSVTWFEKILWLVTFIVFMFVCMFFGFSVYLRSRVRKRLFRERKTFG